MLAAAHGTDSKDRVRVFWQPGCTSCLRTKEFLTQQGVDYESINVHGNPAGMEALRLLGARSVPIVARGGRFVYSQTLTDVVEFLDLKIKLQARLSPLELVQKLDLVLGAAARYVRQIPEDRLGLAFRNRSRPIRALAHHVFRIPEAFLEVVPAGPLSYERIMQEHGPEMRSRLFQAFEQADVSLGRRHEGSGLGTSISRGLVEAMGG